MVALFRLILDRILEVETYMFHVIGLGPLSKHLSQGLLGWREEARVGRNISKVMKVESPRFAERSRPRLPGLCTGREGRNYPAVI